MSTPKPSPAEERAALELALHQAPGSAALHERLSALYEAEGQLAAALAHYKLFHQYGLQERTSGQLTRAALLARLPSLLAMAPQQGLCLLSLSPDGDAVASDSQALAALLLGQCRQRDLVAGQGQETLLLLLVDVDLPIARRVCERIRTAWAQRSQSTLSMGLTAWRGAEDDAQRLLARADAALQAARRAGGNCLRSGAA
jgi:hypothetical protein